MSKYDEKTTLGTLLDDPEAVAVITKYAPDVANHPMLGMAKPMPFGTIIGLAGGQLPAEKIAELKAEIYAL
jgi:hypothetical protein